MEEEIKKDEGGNIAEGSGNVAENNERITPEVAKVERNAEEEMRVTEKTIEVLRTVFDP